MTPPAQSEGREWTLEPLAPGRPSTPLATSGPKLLPGQRVVVVPKADRGVAWILWGLLDGGSKPLGAYASRGVALAAQEAAGAHENADRFDDFWVTPWPLRDEPTLNFRIALASLPAAGQEDRDASS